MSIPTGHWSGLPRMDVRHLTEIHSEHRSQGMVGELWLISVPGAKGHYKGDGVVRGEARGGEWSAGILRTRVAGQGLRPEHRACSSHQANRQPMQDID